MQVERTITTSLTSAPINIEHESVAVACFLEYILGQDPNAVITVDYGHRVVVFKAIQ
jgi:hypothetical protein